MQTKHGATFAGHLHGTRRKQNITIPNQKTEYLEQTLSMPQPNQRRPKYGNYKRASFADTSA